jgi:hypothetical protein
MLTFAGSRGTGRARLPLSVGKTPQTRCNWSLKILRSNSIEIGTGNCADWSIRIDQNKEPPAQGEVGADGLRKPNEVLDVSTVNKLYARYDTLHDARKEDKWVSSFGRRAPDAHAAVFRIGQ